MPDENVDNEKMPNENGYDEMIRVINDDEEGIDDLESADEN